MEFEHARVLAAGSPQVDDRQQKVQNNGHRGLFKVGPGRCATLRPHETHDSRGAGHRQNESSGAAQAGGNHKKKVRGKKMPCVLFILLVKFDFLNTLTV